MPGRPGQRPHVRVPVPRLDLRPDGRPAGRALSGRSSLVRQDRPRAGAGGARVELPGLRLREPEPGRPDPGRAPGRRHAADRPLVRPGARRRGGADGRVGEAPLRRQLEDAARERQRRLSPRVRAQRAVQVDPHAVPARGRRGAVHQGGHPRLGRRPHRDRLVAGVRGAVRVARPSLRHRRRRLRRRARAPGRPGDDAPAHHGGACPRAHLPQPLPGRDQHRHRRAGERERVRALAHADVPQGRAPVRRPAPPHGRGGAWGRRRS